MKNLLLSAILWGLTLLIGIGARSQATPAPRLSTAEKIALDACEKQKQDAQTAYQHATQQEQTIMVEFGAAHPGFHLDGATFAVEADPAKPVKPALPVKR